MLLNIVHEDEHLIVVDKPSGLIVYEERKDKLDSETLTLSKLLSDYRKQLQFLPRCGISHRLDKDTTGLIIIGKSLESLEELKQAFQTHSIQRTYLGLVHGKPLKSAGKITAHLQKNYIARAMKVVHPNSPGKTYEAITFYEVLKTFTHYSLMRFRLHTGKTHQIRAHMLSINHSIVGDPTYSNIKLSTIKRQMLHAYELNYKKQCWVAPLPKDFELALQQLEENRDFIYQ